MDFDEVYGEGCVCFLGLQVDYWPFANLAAL